MSAEKIAYFLAVYVLGGAVAQYPAGWLADAFDRRWVLVWFSIASFAGCVVMIVPFGGGVAGVMVGSMLFGFVTFPIYSIAAAHAHDFASTDERVELSAALLFWFAVGAIVSPLLASQLIVVFGPDALFVMISGAHLVMGGVGLIRMRARPTTQTRTPYVYAPRTSFLIGRLLKARRNRRLHDDG